MTSPSLVPFLIFSSKLLTLSPRLLVHMMI